MNSKARHQARMYALQALYNWILSGNAARDIETSLLEEQNVSKIDLDYFKSLFRGVTSDPDTLDKYMLPYLDRSIKTLTPIELCMLRIAIFELLKRPDVPFRVIINEAVELNKRFGVSEGFKYINGILDQVAKDLRPEEVKIYQVKQDN